MFRHFILTLIVWLGSLVSGVTSVALAQDTLHLQLRWFHQFQFAGYYMAKKKGFFEEEHLQVVIHEGGPGKSPVSEVLSGSVQYGVGNIEVLTRHQQGAPLIALAAIFQHSPSLLLVRQDSGIYSPGDLIDKRVMLYPGHNDPEIEAMLFQQGVRSGDFIRQDSSKNIDDLISGKTDAFNAYLTNEPFYMEEADEPYRAINPRNYGIDFYSDILFTTQDELTNNPERVEAFRRASLKGWEYALEHPEEVIALLKREYQVQKSASHMRYESHMIREMILPNMVELGYMNPRRWHVIAQQLADLSLIQGDYSLEGFLYEPEPSLDWERWRPWLIGGLIFVLGLICFSSGLLQVNRRLKAEIKRREDAEKKALYLAEHDSLTGLINRRKLLTELHVVCQAHDDGVLDDAWVLFIDLDRFKQINDHFGHEAGDRILSLAADIIACHVQSPNLAARVGGDEFVVLIQDTSDPQRVRDIADAILADLSHSLVYQGNQGKRLQVDASIGLACIQPGDDAAALLSKADQAMYFVKHHGKCGVTDYQSIELA